MTSGSINKVCLIGNIVADAVMRQVGEGVPMATFSIATNRSWKTREGLEKTESEFHKIIAWSKLAEICVVLCKRGRKAYLEGRLSTRKWKNEEGEELREQEIILEDIVMLDSPKEEDGTDKVSDVQGEAI